MRIYLASPFFNDKEKETMERVLKVLRNSGYDVFAPYEFKLPDAWELDNAEWGNRIFKEDVQQLSDSSIVVAINHGLWSDTGTAFEVGYAYSLGKPIYIVCFDENIDSLMINNAAIGFINYKEFLKSDKIDIIAYTGKKSTNEQK